MDSLPVAINAIMVLSHDALPHANYLSLHVYSCLLNNEVTCCHNCLIILNCLEETHYNPLCSGFGEIKLFTVSVVTSALLSRHCAWLVVQ